MTDADEYAAIAALVAAGDERDAFARLRARLGWPRGKQLDDLARWLTLLAELAVRRGAPDLAGIATAAARDPQSPDRLYDLGCALIDAGAPSIAASVLWHCLALVGDSEEVVCALVSALESALYYGDAYAVLEQHAALRTRSFVCEYLFAFNAAMTGRIDTTRRVLARLQPDTPETEGMRSTIAAIVERADRVAAVTPLDSRDLRGWQYVLTGCLLGHQSPYGFDDPMHGRYAWLADSVARVAGGLERLVALVRATAAPCVYAPPGRDHEIVARAFAARADLPLAPWPAVGVPAPGVIVLYDLAELPAADLARLAQRRPDQVLFAHACPWTRDVAVAPDVATLLYQSIVSPWHDDLRAPEDLAAELASSSGQPLDERVADEPERWAALVAATWPMSPGPRARMWAGGPVPSNRFE